MKITLIV